MTERPVTFRSDGLQLVGILHEPGGEEPAPVVVFLHGFTGTKCESHGIFVQCARRLASMGIASLRFDFRGSGDSEGAFHEMTVAGECRDAVAATRFIRSQPRFETGPWAMLGMSMGGMVTMLTAPELRPDAVVLWNPVADPRPIRDARMTPERSADFETRGVVDWFGHAIGPDFLRELDGLRPLDSAARVAAPVLIVQSLADETTPPAGAHAYARARGPLSTEIHGIEGADHPFTSIPWTEELIGATTRWLAARLTQPSSGQAARQSTGPSAG